VKCIRRKERAYKLTFTILIDITVLSAQMGAWTFALSVFKTARSMLKSDFDEFLI
jgi:hypothetical protein